jgi:hypothetical protein
MMESIVHEKRCCQCKVIKPRSEFYSNRRKADGLQVRCISCVKSWQQSEEGKADARRYREENREQIRLQRSAYNKTDYGKERNRERHNKESAKARIQAYDQRPEVKEKSRAKAKRYREANHDRLLEDGRNYQSAEPVRRRQRAGHLRRTFGLTPTEYEMMSEAQGHGCAICGGHNQNGSELCVDHDHTTGAIRGLLCHRCNAALGLLNDKPELLSEARLYLLKHSQLKLAV